MSRFNTQNQILGLFAWLALAFATATVGALASIHAQDFYAALTNPDWAPPAWLFGPVWSLLYLLMAIAAWLVWRKDGLRGARLALTLFVAQLALNALWSWLFFSWHLGAAAFIDILLLWLLILATLATFWRVHVLAGVLLLPYLAWVSFAAALCLAVWRLNPQLLS